MQFNLNKFLISISFVLDFIEMDILEDSTNHCKRVAFIALKVGQQYDLSDDELFDLTAYALMHDIGAVKNDGQLKKSELEQDKKHCLIGEQTIQRFPFYGAYDKVIQYHHEFYDGSSHFGKTYDEIHLFSKIIGIADFFELIYSEEMSREELIALVKSKQGTRFSQELIEKFVAITPHESFWLNLKDQFILKALYTEGPEMIIETTFEEIHQITQVFSAVVDSKSSFTEGHSSSLGEKVNKMAHHYGFSKEKTIKMTIASDLHDIGKLAIPNSILEKKGKLTPEEYQLIKTHTYYTRRVIDPLDGFEDIVEWAANHHEKLDGSGYPYGFDESQLDFGSQLFAVLDIYQALREKRPYRKGLSHTIAMEILREMGDKGKLNKTIIEDVHKVFQTSG
jgi:HD-GYP domain-containing protein (c-di-GMP phosphodiesterase class II)